MISLGFEELYTATPPVSYIERSLGYVSSGLLEKLGFSSTPQAKPKPQGFLTKAIRKGLRLTFVEMFAQIASMAGAGPSMEVVFRKAPESFENRNGLGK